MINVTRAELPLLKTYSQYLKKIWNSAWLTNNGEFVCSLEKKLKNYLKVRNISLLSNGTLAIQLAINALDIQGEIITTPFSFAATTTAIIWEKCIPVFADINYETYNIDLKKIEDKITKDTKAILAVHVYGNPCDIEGIDKIAKKYNLKIIYDAAHAFGVKYKDESILNYGDASTLSFHATKVFNTIEGGAVISNSKKIIDKINLLRNFGIISEERVVLAGINAKMNEFQAAMGICNLGNISNKIEKRKRIYQLYKEKLNKTKILFQKLTTNEYNYAYMPVCFESKKIRDQIYMKLLNKGFKVRKYFYPLISDFEFIHKYRIGSLSDLNIARKIANGILCLPMYSELNTQAVEKIANIINDNL